MRPKKCRSIIDTEISKRRPFSRFIFRSNLESWLDPWRHFVNSYENAFYELAEIILLNKSRSNDLSMPLAFLCRHSVELSLKAAIDIVDNGLVDNIDTNTHGLLPLWNCLQKLLRADEIENCDVWALECERYVAHMHEMDRLGDSFRYPTDRQGNFRFTEIEIEDIVRAHWNLVNYCHWAMMAPFEKNNDLVDCGPE